MYNYVDLYFFYKIRYFDSQKILYVSCESDSI